jgi:hypothetical protein
MTTERHMQLAAVIAAHTDRKVVGRTRLQKTVKLLQRLGFPTDYRYTLYFYGPYSEELQSEVDLLGVVGLIEEQPHVAKDGTPYYTIEANKESSLPDIGDFEEPIARLQEADAVVLELAATYDAFRELGCDHDEAWRRLRRKKGSKCDEGRDQAALSLLEELGLTTE